MMANTLIFMDYFRLLGGTSGLHRQQTGSSVLMEKLWTKILVESLSRTELSQVLLYSLLSDEIKIKMKIFQ